MSAKKSTKVKTRKAILTQLKEMGPQTAPALATHLDVTPMAIRLHLYDLAAEQLIDFSEKKMVRGRPAKYWALTDAAQSIFPDAHQSLAVDLLNTITQALGQAGLESVIDAHSQNQLTHYTSELNTATTISERVKRLADIRTREGYMVVIAQDGEDWLFCENHCPICSAAKTCTKLCTNELWVFQEVLGPDVNIVREEHILSGARRCKYRISIL